MIVRFSWENCARHLDIHNTSCKIKYLADLLQLFCMCSQTTFRTQQEKCPHENALHHMQDWRQRSFAFILQWRNFIVFLSFSDLSRRNSFNTKVLIKMQLAGGSLCVSSRKGQTSDCAWVPVGGCALPTQLHFYNAPAKTKLLFSYFVQTFDPEVTSDCTWVCLVLPVHVRVYSSWQDKTMQ